MLLVREYAVIFNLEDAVEVYLFCFACLCVQDEYPFYRINSLYSALNSFIDSSVGSESIVFRIGTGSEISYADICAGGVGTGMVRSPFQQKHHLQTGQTLQVILQFNT